MYLVLCHPFDIQDLNAEQLQYIPKVVLLYVYGDYIDYVWDKLPEHVKADSEVRTYRRCDEHYNQSWQGTHSDGPALKIKNCSECQRRAAVLNRAINALPFELHIPGYQFCGPGTRLTKRLARGEAGINPLDAACREHDIAYSRSNDLTDRYAVDKVLVEKARKNASSREIRL
ncbi:hypothetical protein G5I_13200 [Acromyrmex echinatior]|uniref:Phospholipase A2-like domain-containing protein n=1 Tax=Acromyrmex echinatior TaxID=103372 RepID=F4X4E0_ACREC|nr:hypothetical protein G5I_13200 [Acromyrmex echinatior]